MSRAPCFWTRDNWPARVLTPVSYAVSAITARRTARVGWRAPVPVICCGNATVGGAGKTTLALDLVSRLNARRVKVHVLLRGYRGTAYDQRRVLPGDTAGLTGDEALLLAKVAPTWIGADRAESARSAVAAGAEVLLMDDGLQNPSLEKSMSLLVIDGATGFGNGRVLPAGPLREPVATAASRCRAAVLIGEDTSGALARLPPGLQILRAGLVQGLGAQPLVGRRVVAFAGIAFPEKFFASLKRAGVLVVDRQAFPDHHMFTTTELARLAAKAKALDAPLVTTQKDAVRLPASFVVQIVDVRLVWESESAVEALLEELVSGRPSGASPHPDWSMR